MNHNDLLFSNISSTFVLFDDTGTGKNDPSARLTIQYEASANARVSDRHDRTQYTIKITRDASADLQTPVIYSLLTLGLQAPEHKIRILKLNSSNNDAVLLDEKDPPTVMSKFPQDVDPTGLVKPDPKRPEENPDETKIWFLRFSGQSCNVKAEAIDRKEVGEIGWVFGHFGTGHDNTPPPPQPN